VSAAMIWPIAALGQQPSQKACDLLTRAELEAAIGGSVAPPSGKEIPYKKSDRIDHDGILYECSEIFDGRVVTIKYSTSQVTAEARQRALAIAKDAQDSMRKQGFEVQTKDINRSKCTTIVEPPNPKGPPGPGMPQTACLREKGGYFVSITVAADGSSEVVSMEKVAGLTEKAASRIPAQ
jgi:hypothetical protein